MNLLQHYDFDNEITLILNNNEFIYLWKYDGFYTLNKDLETINIFNSETYEKVLYSYILFRTELLTAIKGLRTVLKLNKPDEPLKLPSEK